MFVPYSELSEAMKEHDRKWARKVLDVLAPALAAARAEGAAEAFERAAKACETEAAECEAASRRWSVHQERKFESCREEAQAWRNRQAQSLRDAAAIRALAREAAKEDRS